MRRSTGMESSKAKSVSTPGPRDDRPKPIAEFQGLGFLDEDDTERALERYMGFHKTTAQSLFSFRQHMNIERLVDREREASLSYQVEQYDAILRCLANKEYLLAPLDSRAALMVDGYRVLNDVAMHRGKPVRLIMPIQLAVYDEYRTAIEKWNELLRQVKEANLPR